jgi:hypothetical protein
MDQSFLGKMRSMDILSLHNHPSRFDRFKASPGIFFSDELRQWIVFEPKLVVELLRDERLVVPNVLKALDKLENRYKRTYSNLRFAAHCIPLLLEGQIHREVRRGLTDLVTDGRVRTTAALPGLMSRYVQPMEKQTSAEWIETTFAPLANAIFCHMCNCPTDLPFPRLVLTRLFDRFVSLAAINAAEEQIGHLRAELEAKAPDLHSAQIVALMIIGRDSLVGTLASSLYSIVEKNLHRRFTEIPFPDFPPETGVAIAERTAVSDIKVGSLTISAGASVRMFFQPMSSADSLVSRLNLFGAGVHSCIGRPISLDVWRALISTLSQFKCRVTSVACEFESNNIFVVPRYLRTEQTE